ncbi:hypothetical protein [Nocardioides sp. URHA0020]|uniref:hypothetical protein n=1 Tax=Nocardioides sp. URHA0020 TaxID=1380392 RepID=UPI0012DD8766|nr:hypothetical protein [Nocardioides sp. URHA0020]
MATGVRLVFSDGRKEMLDEAHVHGFRDGQLVIASGTPGAGFDAKVIRTVFASDLDSAETCHRDDTPPDAAGGSTWSMSWP